MYDCMLFYNLLTKSYFLGRLQFPHIIDLLVTKDAMAKRQAQSTTYEDPRTLLLGVFLPTNKTPDIDGYFEEFQSLADTLGVNAVATLNVKLRLIERGTLLTKGKLQDLMDLCEKEKIEHVICSEILSPLQERNLEDMTGCKVWDREQMILEIFRNAAHSSEGKIQVKMAEVKFLKTRMAGKGIELAQQPGFIGSRGPGETEKEVIKRFFSEKLRQAQKHLEVLQKVRDVQRKRRMGSGFPMVCLVGYTNAGKSSLLNRLTNSEVAVEDKLFVTLDTATRELFVQGEKTALISDTVGFISKLPHNLIEAFRSTLDEVRYADLLLHVIDLSNPLWEDQVGTVHQTLRDLEISKPMLYVFNKIDKLKPADLDTLKAKLELFYTPYVMIETMTKEGSIPLTDFLKGYNFKTSL